MSKGESLLKVILPVLDLSQIEAGRVRLMFESQPVDAIVRSAISSIAPQAQKKGVKLESHLPPSPSVATVDKEKLLQVVVNLLANAVKFTPGDGKVKVRLSAIEELSELGAKGYRIEV